MVVALVGCSEYAPRLNVDYEDSSYRLNPVFPHTLAMLSITGSVVTTSVDLGDYFSIVVISGMVGANVARYSALPRLCLSE